MIIGVLSLLFLSIVLAYFLYVFLDVNMSGKPKLTNRILLFIGRWNPIQQRQTIEALNELVNIAHKREVALLDERAELRRENQRELDNNINWATKYSALENKLNAVTEDHERLISQVYRMSQFLKDRSAFIDEQAAELRFKESEIRALQDRLTYRAPVKTVRRKKSK